jgi:hypothetical protein
MRECFDALRDDPGLKATLFKGGGTSGRQEVRLRNLRRQGLIAGAIAGHVRRDPYVVEQATFVMSLLPHIARQRPDVIFFSDGNIGNMLWHWRRRSGHEYRMLLSNGGPLGPPFPRADHVHQVAPPHLEAALLAGEPPAKHTLLPYGLRVEPSFEPLSDLERVALRGRLSSQRIDQLCSVWRP